MFLMDDVSEELRRVNKVTVDGEVLFEAGVTRYLDFKMSDRLAADEAAEKTIVIEFIDFS